MRDIPLNNLSYGLQVKLGSSLGSAYMIRKADNKVFLVTAKHVLFSDSNLRAPTAEISGYPPDVDGSSVTSFTISLNQMLADGHLLYGRDDVVVAYLGSCDVDGHLTFTQSTLSIQGDQLVWVPEDGLYNLSEVLTGNRVYITGYPCSIGIKNIPQIDYEKPLVRVGIVAGKNINKNTIIIDCPVFPGNSGGPVMMTEKISTSSYRYKIIGTVSQYVPYLGDSSVENSGFSVVVPVDPILGLMGRLTI